MCALIEKLDLEHFATTNQGLQLYALWSGKPGKPWYWVYVGESEEKAMPLLDNFKDRAGTPRSRIVGGRNFPEIIERAGKFFTVVPDQKQEREYESAT